MSKKASKARKGKKSKATGEDSDTFEHSLAMGETGLPSIPDGDEDETKTKDAEDNEDPEEDEQAVDDSDEDEALEEDSDEDELLLSVSEKQPNLDLNQLELFIRNIIQGEIAAATIPQAQISTPLKTSPAAKSISPVPNPKVNNVKLGNSRRLSLGDQQQV